MNPALGICLDLDISDGYVAIIRIRQATTCYPLTNLSLVQVAFTAYEGTVSLFVNTTFDFIPFVSMVGFVQGVVLLVVCSVPVDVVVGSSGDL